MICTADEIMDCNLEHPSESTDISTLSEDKCLLKNANIEGVQTRKRKLNYLSITTGVHSQNSDLDMSSQELSSQATEASVVNIGKLEKLNDFLQTAGCSPVKYLQSSFTDCSERSQRRYIQKAKDCVDLVLSTICPGEGDLLAEVLFPSTNDQKNQMLAADPLLMALTDSFNKAETWTLRQQLLSIISKDKSFDEVSMLIPGLTRYRYYMSRHHEESEGCGMPILVKDTKRQKIDEGTLENFIDFITSSHIVKDLPFGEKTLKLSTGEIIKTPNVIRAIAPSSIVRQYKQYCEEENIVSLGTSTMYKILDECAASFRKSVEGIDYFIAEGGRAFNDLEGILDKVEITQEKTKELKTKLVEAKRYMKSDFKVHLTEENPVPDHCIGFALSDKESCFRRDCINHIHTETCLNCDTIDSLFKEIQTLADEAVFENKEAVLFQVEKAVSDIQEWKMHLIRSRNQNRARTNILSDMDDNECLIIADWAMKFLPRRYREGQTDWFAKRGLNWHISVAYMKGEDEQLTSTTYVHIFDTPASQDSATTSAVLEDVAKDLLAELHPKAIKFHFWSDNAGCYKSSNTIITLHQQLGNNLISYDFCESQDGKGPCDRKSSHIKSSIKRYINEGNDVLSAKQMKQAIDFKQFAGSTYKVKVVDVVIDVEKSAAVKPIPAISSYHNFQFSKDGVTVWKAYGIGKGKVFPWTKIFKENIKVTEMNTVANWTNSIVVLPSINMPKTNAIKDLFYCPNEGCVRTFSRNSSLDQHVMLGFCDFRQEKQPLSDKAKSMYAEKVKESASFAGSITLASDNTQSESSSSELEQGWALKFRKSQVQFSVHQKEYLIQKFDKGNQTGRKEDPVVVADEMRNEKTVTGKYRFSRNEYLTAQQITSFFSREVQKRKKMDSNDFTAAVEEDNKSNLKKNFTVRITPENEHTPEIFTDINMTKELNEDYMVSRSVIEYGKRVKDEDCPKQRLEYSVVKQGDATITGHDGTEYFDIYDNGTLYLKSALDYETIVCGLGDMECFTSM
ncbi:Hypothetical predicted protein [Mytilus galloprovincialis]|nr:Hypothetical predicted protein [Mytilus galloprovincialis]